MNQSLQDESEFVSIIGRDWLIIELNLCDAAAEVSEYLRLALSSGMSEAETKQIRMEHINPNLLWKIAAFIYTHGSNPENEVDGSLYYDGAWITNADSLGL